MSQGNNRYQSDDESDATMPMMNTFLKESNFADDTFFI